MKNFIILAGLTLFTLLLAGLEYLFDSPMEVHWSEVIGGVLVLLIGLVCCRRMNAKPKKMLTAAISGIVLIAAVNVATNAVYMWKILLDADPNMTDGIFLSLTFMIAVYVPFVYIGAIWLYLYYFCDLHDAMQRIKRLD